MQVQCCVRYVCKRPLSVSVFSNKHDNEWLDDAFAQILVVYSKKIKMWRLIILAILLWQLTIIPKNMVFVICQKEIENGFQASMILRSLMIALGAIHNWCLIFYLFLFFYFEVLLICKIPIQLGLGFATGLPKVVL